MIAFLLGFVCGVSVLGSGVYMLCKDTPRACAFPSCTTNHWGLGKYCSHHELDQDDERYR